MEEISRTIALINHLLTDEIASWVLCPNAKRQLEAERDRLAMHLKQEN